MSAFAAPDVQRIDQAVDRAMLAWVQEGQRSGTPLGALDSGAVAQLERLGAQAVGLSWDQADRQQKATIVQVVADVARRWGRPLPTGPRIPTTATCRWCAGAITRTRADSARPGWTHDHTGRPGCTDLLGRARQAKPTDGDQVRMLRAELQGARW